MGISPMAKASTLSQGVTLGLGAILWRSIELVIMSPPPSHKLEVLKYHFYIELRLAAMYFNLTIG
jgi:hypothetical protein